MTQLILEFTLLSLQLMTHVKNNRQCLICLKKTYSTTVKRLLLDKIEKLLYLFNLIVLISFLFTWENFTENLKFSHFRFLSFYEKKKILFLEDESILIHSSLALLPTCNRQDDFYHQNISKIRRKYLVLPL